MNVNHISVSIGTSTVKVEPYSGTLALYTALLAFSNSAYNEQTLLRILECAEEVRPRATRFYYISLVNELPFINWCQFKTDELGNVEVVKATGNTIFNEFMGDTKRSAQNGSAATFHRYLMAMEPEQRRIVMQSPGSLELLKIKDELVKRSVLLHPNRSSDVIFDFITWLNSTLRIHLVDGATMDDYNSFISEAIGIPFFPGTYSLHAKTGNYNGVPFTWNESEPCVIASNAKWVMLDDEYLSTFESHRHIGYPQLVAEWAKANSSDFDAYSFIIKFGELEFSGRAAQKLRRSYNLNRFS
jgi:hypothetical protein